MALETIQKEHSKGNTPPPIPREALRPKAPKRALRFRKEESAPRSPSWIRGLFGGGILILSFGMVGHHIGLERNVYKKETKGNHLSVQEKRPTRMKWNVKRNVIVFKTRAEIQGPLSIQIASIDGEVLSPKKIELKATAEVKSKSAIFRELHFTNGHHLAWGYYEVTFDHPKLKDQKLKLYYGQDEALFPVKLSRYQDLQNNQGLVFQSEVLERWATLNSLLDRMRTIFEEEMKFISKGHEIDHFTKRYTREVSMVIHGVTFDHKEARLKVPEDKEFLVREYFMLGRFGRRVGESVLKMVNETKKVATIDTTSRQRLTSKFVKEIKQIQQKIRGRIEGIQAHI